MNDTEQVSVVRSEATKSWSDPARCDVTCNTGYEKKGNQCIFRGTKEPIKLFYVKLNLLLGSECKSNLVYKDAFSFPSWMRKEA